MPSLPPVRALSVSGGRAVAERATTALAGPAPIVTAHAGTPHAGPRCGTAGAVGHPGTGRGRLRPPAVLVAAAALAPVLAVAGCGAGAVEAPVPRPPASVARLCDGLRARLPQRLHGQSRRATTPRSPLVTAWGSPAIVVRCGVPRPSGLKKTSELAVLDGVSWLALPPDRPVTFTAVGRRAYVEVTVPPKYTPQGDVLIELAAPIKAAIPANPDASL